MAGHRLNEEQLEAGRAVAIRKRKEASELIRKKVLAVAGLYETQGEIARALGISRVTVNKVLREARDDS